MIQAPSEHYVHLPYDVTFHRGPEGEGNFQVTVIDIPDEPNGVFRHEAKIRLQVKKNGEFEVILPDNDNSKKIFGEYLTETASPLKKKTHSDGGKILWCALRSLHEFPIEGESGVFRLNDGFEYGFQRDRIDRHDTLPWRRIYTTKDYLDDFRSWREEQTTPFDLLTIANICETTEFQIHDPRGEDPQVDVSYIPLELSARAGRARGHISPFHEGENGRPSGLPAIGLIGVDNGSHLTGEGGLIPESLNTPSYRI